VTYEPVNFCATIMHSVSYLAKIATIMHSVFSLLKLLQLCTVFLAC